MPIFTKHFAPIGLVVVGFVMALAAVFGPIPTAGATDNEVVIKSVHFDLGNADSASTDSARTDSGSTDLNPDAADPGVADFSFAGEATARYRTLKVQYRGSEVELRPFSGPAQVSLSEAQAEGIKADLNGLRVGSAAAEFAEGLAEAVSSVDVHRYVRFAEPGDGSTLSLDIGYSRPLGSGDYLLIQELLGDSTLELTAVDADGLAMGTTVVVGPNYEWNTGYENEPGETAWVSAIAIDRFAAGDVPVAAVRVVGREAEFKVLALGSAETVRPELVRPEVQTTPESLGDDEALESDQGPQSGSDAGDSAGRDQADSDQINSDDETVNGENAEVDSTDAGQSDEDSTDTGQTDGDSVDGDTSNGDTADGDSVDGDTASGDGDQSDGSSSATEDLLVAAIGVEAAIQPAIDVGGVGCDGATRVGSGTGSAISAGQPATYCFTVTNLGSTHLSNLAVTDSALGLEMAVLPRLSGPQILEPGEQVVLYHHASAVQPQGTATTVTATATDSQGIPIEGFVTTSVSQVVATSGSDDESTSETSTEAQEGVANAEEESNLDLTELTEAVGSEQESVEAEQITTGVARATSPPSGSTEEDSAPQVVASQSGSENGSDLDPAADLTAAPVTDSDPTESISTWWLLLALALAFAFFGYAVYFSFGNRTD